MTNAIRASVFVSAVAIALLAAEQGAHAEDTPVPAETPAPEPGTGGPPTDGTVPAPTTPTTPPDTTPTPVPEVPTTPPPVVIPIPGGSIDIPPVTSAPGTPPAPGNESNSPSVDGPFPAGTGTHTNQSAGVGTGGAAVANTGGNTAVATGSSGPLDETASFRGRAGSVIQTGTATGQGSVDQTGISQQVNAIVTDNGRVVVVQVAIVVNIGIGLASSGGNRAGAESATPPRPASSVGMIVGNEASGAGTGPTPARINTGTANSTGNTGTTQVTQSIVLTGNDISSQLAAVLNIGVGVSNSGLNFALASVSGNNSGTPSSVTFVTMGGGSSIGAGPATALGNRSTSAVFQVVTVTASGNGSLLVVQRAIIVNFGLALANSGHNAAGGGAISAAMPDTAAAQELLLLLLSPGTPGTDAVSAVSGSGGGTIAISTGGAHAIGNDTTTGIRQQVTGSVTGEETARAIQDAWVGNFGIGVANSGGNAAGSSLAGIDAASLDAARGALQAFLSGLTGIGDPVQGLDGTFQLGSNLLQLHGDVSGTESLLGITEPGAEISADDASVVVRQVTAVLNIGLALGDSGHNVAVSTAHSTTLGGGTGTVAVATTTIDTGDAAAVGNDFVTTVCQTIGDAVACAAPDPDPPPDVEEPETPVVHPTTEIPPAPEAPPSDPFSPPAAQPVQAAISTLPFTGSPIGAELAAGSGLLIAGMLMARRRRTKAAT